MAPTGSTFKRPFPPKERVLLFHRLGEVRTFRRLSVIIKLVQRRRTGAPGSRVHVGGDGRFVNYIEVLGWPNTPSITRKLAARCYCRDKHDNHCHQRQVAGFKEYALSNDTWYVDWDAGVDGNGELNPGDEVKIGVDPRGKAVLIERTYTPRFRVKVPTARQAGALPFPGITVQ